MTREVKVLSNDYPNPNTNPNTLTTLTLTLTDPHGAFENLCAPAFCDFVRNYSCTVDGAVVTSIPGLLRKWEKSFYFHTWPDLMTSCDLVLAYEWPRRPETMNFLAAFFVLLVTVLPVVDLSSTSAANATIRQDRFSSRLNSILFYLIQSSVVLSNLIWFQSDPIMIILPDVCCH